VVLVTFLDAGAAAHELFTAGFFQADHIEDLSVMISASQAGQVFHFGRFLHLLRYYYSTFFD
jgi:hypothetical protein